MSVREIHDKYALLRDKIAWGGGHIACVFSNGSIGACGNNKYGQTDIRDDAYNAYSVAVGSRFSAYLTYDGTVQWSGEMAEGELYGLPPEKWPARVKKIACGSYHIVGLTVDGILFSYGNNKQGQCEVIAWEHIRDVVCGVDFTIGIREDGSIQMCGNIRPEFRPVLQWDNIDYIRIEEDSAMLVGIKKDGTAVCTAGNVEAWKGIIDVTICRYHAYGLSSDGHVYANDPKAASWVADWKDVVCVFAQALQDSKTPEAIGCITKSGDIFISKSDGTHNHMKNCQAVFGVTSSLYGSVVVKTTGECMAFASDLSQAFGHGIKTIADAIVESFHDDIFLFHDIEEYAPMNISALQSHEGKDFNRALSYQAPAASSEEAEFQPNFSINEVSIYNSLQEAYSPPLSAENQHADDYIASCVYSSYDCPEVRTLRRYRDTVLASTWYGKFAVKAYYFLTPLFVICLKNASWLNQFFLKKLNEKVKRLNESGIENTEYEDKKIF